MSYGHCGGYAFNEDQRVGHTEYLLELNSAPASWVDDSEGDPGRTTHRHLATRFQSAESAGREAVKLANLYGLTISVVRA